MAYAETSRHRFDPIGFVLRWVGDIRQNISDNRKIMTTYRELSALSDRELFDLGIARGDIRDIALQAVKGH